MYTEGDYSKFIRNLSKIISVPWSKLSRSTSNSVKSDKNIDQQLEEEYETLLREINYLTAEKSCYLSFLNDNFTKAKSSEDLSDILKKHSSEVLKNYIKKHDTVKNGKPMGRQDLINYVTEIVISRHKCNNKLCSCKPIKVSKEVLTDSSVLKENRKETQTRNISDNAADKATSRPILTQTISQTKSEPALKTVATFVQTDDWNHDPFCKCGCCPKTKLEIGTKSVITDEKPVQETATSDRRITASKDVLANCIGESVETNTSKRFCVPKNFETLIEEDKTYQRFSLCTAKKDCACDAYDVQEAVRMGLVLPSSDICIQKKKVKISDRTKQETKVQDFSDGSETTNTSLSDKPMKKEKKKNKKKEKEKKKKAKEENKKRKRAESNSSTPQGTPKKKKRKGTTTCFGPRRKKSKCDEYCLGISEAHRSMQTLEIKTQDRGEHACLCNENGKKVAQTGTDSEVATQVSARPSNENLNSKQDGETSSLNKKRDRKTLITPVSNKQDRETWSKPEGQDRETWSRPENMKDRETWSRQDSMQNKETSPRMDNRYDRETWARADRGETEGASSKYYKTNKGTATNKDRDMRDICNKCGRLKRDCVSGCRNTIIIPYASGSSNGLPAGEVESLRMLIKMQNKDANRQFDSIMTELNHQKSEVRRLNNMYQKMMENFYEMQKVTSASQSQGKKSSDLSRDCHCPTFSSSGKRSNTERECGCRFSNECNIVDMSTGRSYDATINNNSNDTYNGQLRKFGPPNTAVAINRCDVSNLKIAGNSSRIYSTKENDYQDGDKKRKDQINQFKKADICKQNELAKRGIGDRDLPNVDSVSTIYKKENKLCRKGQSVKTDVYEGLSDNTNDYIEISEDPDRNRDAIDIEADKASEQSEKKTRGNKRIFIWFKKSWISMKNKSEECRKEAKEEGMKCVLNFVLSKVKQATSAVCKVAKQAL